MTKKIFPIKNDPACVLKWAWSTVFFNSGSSASCHRTQKYAIDPANFDQFHNLPEKIQAREKMLKGEWPGAGCEYCRHVEDSGGVSDRLHQLMLQKENPDLVPLELWDNPTATSVMPTILEVYFKNTCNMKCVYCGPHFSSLWQEENVKFNSTFADPQNKFDVRSAQHNPHYDQMVSDFWNFLDRDENFRKLQRYHILGGEPFLMKELDDSIDFWDNHGNPDLIFSIITNLNIPTERFKKYIKKFERLVLGNKIWKLQLTASIDGWGKEIEYVRFGLDIDLWRQNFELLINKPWVTLSINSAISALSIKTMPELIKLINHWNSQQTLTAGRWKSEPIAFSFNTTGALDDPYKFGPNLFAEDFEKILELMPRDTEQQNLERLSMEGIANAMKSGTINVAAIQSLKQYLDELDCRRGTNWRVLFPWLNQDFSVQ
jgi:hypothetical protein